MARRLSFDDTLKAAQFLNRLLESNAPQETKRELCTLVEALLTGCNCYDGFNYLYWLDKGYRAWRDAGEPEQPEKEKFITGSGENPEIEGEYSRSYSLRKLRQAAKGAE